MISFFVRRAIRCGLPECRTEQVCFYLYRTARLANDMSVITSRVRDRQPVTTDPYAARRPPDRGSSGSDLNEVGRVQDCLGRPELPEAFVARITSTPDGRWRAQPLLDHLVETGERAANFAQPFGAEDWARLAGRLHDLGKYQPAWQDYIRRTTGFWTDAPAVRIRHAIVGAIYAIDQLGDLGRLIAYPLAGHHAGLPDWFPSDVQGQGALQVQLQTRELLDTTLQAAIPGEVLSVALLDPPRVATEDGLHLWIRMLFSCLVDADSLNAERHENVRRSTLRESWQNLTDLAQPLQTNLERLPRRGPIDELRTSIRRQAVAKYREPAGFFSLSVPTGGGKTLTSLEFAVRHAIHHGKTRVIYAIPYLSIIEQTAEVFRDVLGERLAVLEHHSNLDPDTMDEESKVSGENWDVPVVVTTVVQLFESLFGSRRSRSRKVHNIANSVLVLDEVQLLPPQFLTPIATVLNELVRAYGVSVVLSTATLPSLEPQDVPGRRFKGISGVRELIDDPVGLATQLDRVEVEWPADLDERMSWEDVAAQLRVERQVLCVVNARADCRELVSLLSDETIHLSALMCAEHRSLVIGRIKADLAAGLPLRVVSTQLVEAGVDIDFPVVFRALAGLDSIAQAAGRCNREGKIAQGRVVVFVPPKSAPIGHLRKAEQATRALLSSVGPAAVLTPAGFRRYFDLLYSSMNLDEFDITRLLSEGAFRGEFPFRTVSQRFQMIAKDGSGTVLVGYDERARRLLVDLERVGPDKNVFRGLQRYTVSIHNGQVQRLLANGEIREIVPGAYTLVDEARYHPRFGLLVDDPPTTMEGLLI